MELRYEEFFAWKIDVELCESVRHKPSDEKVEDFATSIDAWEADNVKVITWINNSVTHSIGAQWRSTRLRKRSGTPGETLYSV